MGEDEERFNAQTHRGGNGENGEDRGRSLDPERERSYAELFEQLDLNKDGRVDISELKIGLAARGLHEGEAEEVRHSYYYHHRSRCNRAAHSHLHTTHAPSLQAHTLLRPIQICFI